MLRRVLGANGPLLVVPRSLETGRIALPRGVIKTTIPGPLVRAGDGTQVRGYFGNRNSGHGFGQRGVNHLPLARLTNTSEIEAAVRDIDKACGRRTRHSQTERTGGQAINRSAEQSSQRSSRAGVPASTRVVLPIVDTLTARQAIEREQRALRALRAEKRKNARLQIAIKALRPALPISDIENGAYERGVTDNAGKSSTRHERMSWTEPQTVEHGEQAMSST